MPDADREKRQAMELDPSVIEVHVDVMDLNDNAPHFDRDTFYAGNTFPHRYTINFVQMTTRHFFLFRCGLQFE